MELMRTIKIFKRKQLKLFFENILQTKLVGILAVWNFETTALEILIIRD
jgi:hypothetical protein